MKKTKRFVLDTNTLISAFILPQHSNAARAYAKVKSLGEIVISDDTFNELNDVFIRPKFDRYISLKNRLKAIQDLKEVVKIIPVSITIEVCRDAKDDKFLELAVAAGAACIVTGDKDLLVLNPFRDIPILTPAEFLSITI